MLKPFTENFTLSDLISLFATIYFGVISSKILSGGTRCQFSSPLQSTDDSYEYTKSPMLNFIYALESFT